MFLRTLGSFIRLAAVILLRSGICFASGIVFDSLWANKIPLKPKVLIKLLIYQKYHSVRSTEYHLKKQKNYSIIIAEVIIMADSVLRDKLKKTAELIQVFLRTLGSFIRLAASGICF